MSFKVTFKGGEAGKLDPQTEEFLRGLKKGDGKPLIEVHPDSIRSAPSPTAAYNLHPAPVAIEEISVPVRDEREIRVRVYRKNKEKAAPPLIYYHGGCWVFCSLDTHDALCRQLCQDSGMTVFSIDYRLAPENKFPAGINDAYDTAKWISKNNDLLNTTADDIILSGDSAGGNISTVVSLTAAREKEFKIRGQLLFYPITDISKKAASYSDFSTGYFLTEELMDYGANHYINSNQDRESEYISPLLAKDLQLMPKTLIQTAEFDVLRDEGEAYAEKLAGAGVDVECVRYNGLIHAYAALAGGIDLGREAVEDAVKFLKTFQ